MREGKHTIHRGRGWGLAYRQRHREKTCTYISSENRVQGGLNTLHCVFLFDIMGVIMSSRIYV